ncbi:hypothetical protein FKW78_05610 [Mycolicibacterium fortuitum]|nr:hypothetical protein [Mycolicibacterium fortuitum]TPW96818.1 hypothetical protein FKW78_05610 [Mycolicibacterium fortuitum]UBV21970.1 hypothetical protein H8Z59_01615 [Mycolicibacterium fortuitum]BDE01878.1 hypothetical protein MFTT_59710 [Mycolicibacterium fortuitum subsp. fortuitum]
MLPSRPRLERWNPDSLTPAGQSVETTGASVGLAVTRINDKLKTMPETKSWSGNAHNAAVDMFGRAKGQTDAFSTLTKAIGGALIGSSDPIARTQKALLNKAEQIDRGGQLHVSDQWVVLITGGEMTAEQAAALEKRAQAEQADVNELLKLVGAADDAASAKLIAAAKLRAPDPNNPRDIITAMGKPVDEVPNPASGEGQMQQAVIRDAEMEQQVRETKVETKYDPVTGAEVSTITTIYKQNGSKDVIEVHSKSYFDDREPATINENYDKNGNLVAKTEFVKYKDWAPYGMGGAEVMTTTYPDKTSATVTQYPDGRKLATVTRPGGVPQDVPLNVFSHPALAATSNGLSGLEKLKDAHDFVKAGGKYGGPAVSFATALWDVTAAGSDFQRCVAIAEGATSLTAGVLGGIVASPSTPAGAIAVSYIASTGGQALGNWLGNTFCPR